MQWADSSVLAAALKQEADYPALTHIYAAEEVWLRRLTGEESFQLAEVVKPAGMKELAEVWPALHQRWTDFAASVSDWEAMAPHRTSLGERIEMPIWQIAMHVVNHGSHHRGQVSMQMRQAGHAPPPTDLIIFYRTLK
jgi:uncharacterized damage-inducible protein DinB